MFLQKFSNFRLNLSLNFLKLYLMRNAAFLIVLAAFFYSHASLAQYQFIAPLPGSTDHNPDRNIIIRDGNLMDAAIVNRKNLFSIHGSLSGIHDFDIVLCRDQRTILLNPLTAFTEGETVTVNIGNGLQRLDGTAAPAYTFHFSIHRKYDTGEMSRINAARAEQWEQEFGNQVMGTGNEKSGDNAGTSLPPFYITTNTNPSPGEIFFHNYNFYGYETYHHCIITNNGDSIYSSGANNIGWDFKINKNGYLTMYRNFPPKFESFDSSFIQIGSYLTKNGYLTDIHEFQIFSDGHYYLQAYSNTFMDLSVYDPSYNKNALITGLVIQKFDKDKNLLFEWRSIDHIPVIEAPHAYFGNPTIDYVHGNAIEEDLDGNIIISCRHLDQVNKLDVNTGNFIWRLGGVKNEFTLLNDSIWFTYQHDVRQLPNGHITLFDNGNFHADQCSYAREYELDVVNKTATLVWSYKHPDVNGKHVYGSALGSVQRLSNGNSFINWGGILPGKDFPNLTEVTPEGEIVWEMKLKDKYNDVIYRAHKYEWNPCARTLSSKMKAKDITATSANLEWHDANGATAYKLQHREVGTTQWSNKTIDDGSSAKLLKNLEPATTYEWHVQTICSNGVTSPYTDMATFTTLPQKQAATALTITSTVYPNPAKDVVHIALEDGIQQNISVQLQNLLGVVLYQDVFIASVSGKLLTLPVKDFPAGIYYLLLKSGNTESAMKIVIE